MCRVLCHLSCQGTCNVLQVLKLRTINSLCIFRQKLTQSISIRRHCSTKSSHPAIHYCSRKKFQLTSSSTNCVVSNRKKIKVLSKPISNLTLQFSCWSMNKKGSKSLVSNCKTFSFLSYLSELSSCNMLPPSYLINTTYLKNHRR
nr:hypothetical protein Iba_chr11cCG3140 [Ipomoea batatas]GMD58324.1 hypothetical protein Iba_chr11fCG4480 [Ipomoea batatas]